jgi:hypothetical protein
MRKAYETLGSLAFVPNDSKPFVKALCGTDSSFSEEGKQNGESGSSDTGTENENVSPNGADKTASALASIRSRNKRAERNSSRV